MFTWHRTDKFERGSTVVILHQSDETEYSIETRTDDGFTLYMVCRDGKDVQPFYTFREAKRFVMIAEARKEGEDVCTR